MNDLGYIAACEIQSPNSPDFDRVVANQRRYQACLVLLNLRANVFDALNKGEIDDENYCVICDALENIVFE
jgi:hypothetical protein